MIVPESVRKCVVFVGCQMADGRMRMVGSAFFIGRGQDDGVASDVHLVTARHVIEGIRHRGLDEVYVRGNTKAGTAVWARCQSNDWRFHPTEPNVDIALLNTGVPSDWDHLVLPIDMCATHEAMAKNEVGLGDEVFITGLFRHHHGQHKNVPIVRVGNIAALPEEKIVTQAFGGMDAFLIEARSIGGLSGSPVFLNLGVTRYIGGSVKHSSGGPFYLLLGLVHGHFDAPATAVDESNQDTNDPLSIERVNTGIAIVTPITKVLDALNLTAPNDA